MGQGDVPPAVPVDISVSAYLYRLLSVDDADYRCADGHPVCNSHHVCPLRKTCSTVFLHGKARSPMSMPSFHLGIFASFIKEQWHGTLLGHLQLHTAHKWGTVPRNQAGGSILDFRSRQTSSNQSCCKDLTMMLTIAKHHGCAVLLQTASRPSSGFGCHGKTLGLTSRSWTWNMAYAMAHMSVRPLANQVDW